MKLSMREPVLDAEVAAAWQDRMEARRHICDLLVRRLDGEGVLSKQWDLDSAAEIHWVTTSWEVWERFVIDLAWSPHRYGQYSGAAYTGCS